MEFLLIWLLISVEKFAALAAEGKTLFWSGLVVILALYVLSFGFSKDAESFKRFATSTKRYRTIAGTIAVFGLMLSIVSVILPTKKELAVIIGAGVTYNVITSTDAQEIGGKAVTILKNKVNEILEDQTVKQEKRAIPTPPPVVIPTPAPLQPSNEGAKKVSNVIEDSLPSINVTKVVESATIISKNSIDIGAEMIKDKIDSVVGTKSQEVKQETLPKAI